MAKKDVIVKVTVNNAGLDFEDDVDIVIVTVPAELKSYELAKVITKADKELRVEDDEGECLYYKEGWNMITLMNKICDENDWSWRHLRPEIEFTIG